MALKSPSCMDCHLLDLHVDVHELLKITSLVARCCLPVSMSVTLKHRKNDAFNTSAPLSTIFQKKKKQKSSIWF